ncbi:ArsR family transcriptional regulator [Xylanibacillus composti]|uniref:Transcriptional regulator n=1 Tax=Xylanibacillus composti TaxID=1572762 RepID=A0A8J4H808_9BACL|nr:metalloregulator ArsR/SmtB family transcription factor [Xylanibacillus composti]MDT9726324.1 ArsR family transcriptional regulator [Xylanibacillus composti]GIQ70568.1 transcriptional regulator [Xylanibacillus composti]
MAKDSCEIYCFDKSKVERVQQTLERFDIGGMAQLFKLLADETRMKIAFALCEEDELCVCDAANIIGSSVATASHHLRTMHKQGVVHYRKAGKMVFYSWKDAPLRQLIRLAAAGQRELIAHGTP